jgi:hypothetical protein
LTTRKISPAQAAARASNGREHSTGPKTPEGKKASSMNALKHGGYAEANPVIPVGPLAEDTALYETFREGVKANLKVEGPLEEELGDNVAALLWRRRRPAAYEALYLATDAAVPTSRRVEQAAFCLPFYERAARVLDDPQDTHRLDALEDAAVATSQAAGSGMGDDWPQPQPSDEAGWITLIDYTLAEHNLTREDAASYCHEQHDEWKATLDHALAEHQATTVVRVLDSDLLVKTARAEAHIGRELDRTISLLRTLQADRRAAEEGA